MSEKSEENGEVYVRDTRTNLDWPNSQMVLRLIMGISSITLGSRTFFLNKDKLNSGVVASTALGLEAYSLHYSRKFLDRETIE